MWLPLCVQPVVGETGGEAGSRGADLCARRHVACRLARVYLSVCLLDGLSAYLPSGWALQPIWRVGYLMICSIEIRRHDSAPAPAPAPAADADADADATAAKWHRRSFVLSLHPDCD